MRKKPPAKPVLSRRQITPLEYVMAVLNDPDADPARKDRLAIGALPHTAAGRRLSLKERQQQAAELAAFGPYQPSPTPKLKH